ncbi:class I SAM-dependent methyltransferase [Pannus brasiliensis CCIBt3594]|uniref:Class I SAM-dependent methyltransferase n=1 Tax=Pannus brasiliensis CCIBt3594 TaxID=1427578 RepID=A0AAW9QFK6_9CHRO
MKITLNSYVNKMIRGFSLPIAPLKTPSVYRYKPRNISARETIDMASKKGISVSDYVETLWNQKSHAKTIVNRFQKLGMFDNKITTVLEIGTGTGIHAEKIIQLCQPERYESYETDRDWADWLARQYNLISRNADGRSLDDSADYSIDLVFAHGVFIYIPFLTVCQYFQEIVRVTKEGGYVAFDIFSEECFDDETLRAWIDSNYDIPYFLRKNYVLEFFRQSGFKLVEEFFNDHFDVGRSKYLVFQKTRL